MKYRRSNAYTFEYDGINFLVVNSGECYDVFANNQHQFGVTINPDYCISNIDDIVKLVVANYENGNIFIEE